MTDSNSELLAWSATFSDMHREIGNYEKTAQDVAALDSNAVGRRGTGQLISFQLAKLLEAVLAAGRPDEGSPIALLIGRYTSKLTLLNIEPVPTLEEGQRRLRELTSELSEVAKTWAESGVDTALADRFTDEVKVDAVKIQAAADDLNQ